MTWQSIQLSEQRLRKLWFLPEPVRSRYRKTRVRCSCAWCQSKVKAKETKQSEVYQAGWDDWQDLSHAVLNNRTQNIWRGRFKPF